RGSRGGRPGAPRRHGDAGRGAEPAPVCADLRSGDERRSARLTGPWGDVQVVRLLELIPRGDDHDRPRVPGRPRRRHPRRRGGGRKALGRPAATPAPVLHGGRARRRRGPRPPPPGAPPPGPGGAWAGAPGPFRGKEPAFRAWVFTIARHELLDWRRRAA